MAEYSDIISRGDSVSVGGRRPLRLHDTEPRGGLDESLQTN